MRDCTHDADCQKPTCEMCQNEESCVRVLSIPPIIGIRPGDSLEVLHLTVPLFNVLKETAKLKDTWTVRTQNAGSYSGSDRYRIKGRPGVTGP